MRVLGVYVFIDLIFFLLFLMIINLFEFFLNYVVILIVFRGKRLWYWDIIVKGILLLCFL